MTTHRRTREPGDLEAIQAAVEKCLDLSPGERALFLDGLDREQPGLRTEVESLLAASDEDKQTLDSPLLGTLGEGARSTPKPPRARRYFMFAVPCFLALAATVILMRQSGRKHDAADTAADRETANNVSQCSSEWKALCPTERPGFGLLWCLSQHADRLSGPCQERLSHAKILNNCQADIKSQCGSATSGDAVYTCLRQRRAELSPRCFRLVPPPRADLGRDCRSDIDTLCPQTNEQNRRVVQCLRQHGASLTPSCKGLLFRSPATNDSPETGD